MRDDELKKLLKLAIIKRIINLQIGKDLTTNGLSYKSNLTQSTVHNVINGNSNNIKIFTLIKICRGLNVSISEFFNDKEFISIFYEC